MKKNFFFETLPSYLIISLPILLITGPFLSDLAVSIISIIFIFNSFQNNLKKYYNNVFVKIFILFWIILICSSLLSNDVIISLKNSFFYFRFGLFSLCFWYLLEKNKFILKYLFVSILICFFSLIIDGYIQYTFGKNIFGIEMYRENRVSSFFGSELILGSYLSRLFPILFGLFVYLDQKKSKKFLILITFIFIFTEGLIFLSGERLALFFMNFSAIYIILMIDNYKIYRLWTYVISIFLILILFNMYPKSKERIIDQTINDMTKNDSGQLYIFSKPHHDMYTSAYRMFLDNKFFGVGPRQYRNECVNYIVSEYSCETHPHNTYIELLSEAGVFAFLIIATIFIYLCFISFRHFIYRFLKKKKGRLNDFQVCLLSAVLISLWPFSPSGSFFNNWMSIVYFIPVGIILWQVEVKKHKIKDIK